MYLLLGGAGMLGSSFVEELSKYGSPKLLLPSRTELDLTKEEAVFAFFKQHAPKVVINCAAARNVDWCEQHPQEAFLQNAATVGILARACQANRAQLHHISTEYVFDGLKDGLYTEADETNPINVYGSSKLFAEKHALRGGAFVYRVQWLYGSSKTNFVGWLASVLLNNGRASITSAQVGCPLSTSWVAQIVLLAIGKNIKPSLYHVSHDDFCSRLEVAQAVCDYFGKSFDDHFDVIGDTNFGIAKRPMNSRMSNSKLKSALGLATMGGWREDLNYYLSRVYKK